MYVCMYVCMHACMYIHIHTHSTTLRTQFPMKIIHVYIYTCIHVYIYTYIHTHALYDSEITVFHEGIMHTYIHTYIHTFTRTRMQGTSTGPAAKKRKQRSRHTYIHTYMHTYIHTHTHAGYKYWSCCKKKKTTDFSEFLTFTGCTKGTCLFVDDPTKKKKALCRYDFFQQVLYFMCVHRCVCVCNHQEEECFLQI